LALSNANSLQTPPAKPKLDPVFTAHVNVQTPVGGLPFNMTGTFLYDINNGVLLDLITSFFGYSFDYLSIETPTGSYLEINGQCRPSANTFTGWFGWIQGADFNGTRTVNGVACNEWQIARGGVPVVGACATDTTIVEFSVYGGARGVNIIFSNVTAAMSNPIPVPADCTQPPPACPQAGWKQLQFYRLHSYFDQAVGQRNFADIMGDFAYICPVLYQNDTRLVNNATVVSQFEILVNTTWGQYALCNAGICVGGDNAHVGQEAAMGVGKHGGLCQSNALTGNWYSFTNASMCPSTTMPPSPDCSWQVVRRVKSVTTACLVANDLYDACVDDIRNGGFPWKAAVTVLKRALTFSSGTPGGCDDKPP